MVRTILFQPQTALERSRHDRRFQGRKKPNPRPRISRLHQLFACCRFVYFVEFVAKPVVGACPACLVYLQTEVGMVKNHTTGRLAQLVEHCDHTAGVTGSSPVAPTIPLSIESISSPVMSQLCAPVCALTGGCTSLLSSTLSLYSTPAPGGAQTDLGPYAGYASTVSPPRH